MLFSKPWFQEKVILVSLPGGRHRFSSWRRWLGCCSNPAVRNRQRKTVDFQRAKKTAKKKKVNRTRGEFICCVDIVLSHWNIDVWKSSYLQGIWAGASPLLRHERAGRIFVCVIFPFHFWDLLLIYHFTCPPAFWPFKFLLICTNSNFSATSVCVFPHVFISRISFTPDRGGRYGWCSWEVQWVLLHCEMSLVEYFQIGSSSSFTILKYKQRQYKHLRQSLYCCDTKRYAYFYRTRVRSLGMLVSDWLTHWLTHSVTFSKLDWCDPDV